ncbi:MAG: glycosyltransferase family 4 protein [Flavitalea sp.]
MQGSKKVLFLVPYPLHKAPSQRFRVELFFSLLQEHNIEYEVRPFLDLKTWNIIYKKASVFQKIKGVAIGFLKRIKLFIGGLGGFDYVFIHREATPVGPPVVEWMIAKIWKKKIIYDFDDAIWISDTRSKLMGWMKAFYKVGYICKWSYKISAGNKYLMDYAGQYANQVVMLPTCVDVQNQHNKIKIHKPGKVVIGWTGSHSTLKYLDALVPVLKKITSEYDAEFLVICNQPPAFSFDGLKFISWKEESEIEDLLKIDIGLMPLVPDDWSEGKCGFKLIQYLSLGIPSLASPVGVNINIIEEGMNGFLCSDSASWYASLETLITNHTLRETMGRKGREKILKEFSIQAHSATFLSLFD